jgi:cell division cycle 20, cofactor of APC complex
MQVAIALGNTAYLWNASDGTIQLLTELSQADDYITSIAWAADGKHLSVGTASAQVQIWDVDRVKQIRSLRGHSARVTALAWNNTTLSSGGRDSIIQNHDVRCNDTCSAMQHFVPCQCKTMVKDSILILHL